LTFDLNVLISQALESRWTLVPYLKELPPGALKYDFLENGFHLEEQVPQPGYTK